MIILAPIGESIRESVKREWDAYLQRHALTIRGVAEFDAVGGGLKVAASVPKQKTRAKAKTKCSSNTPAVAAKADDDGGDPDPEPEPAQSVHTTSPASSHSPALTTSGIKLISKPTVCATADISPALMYVLIKRENFPHPVKIGRASRWIESEVIGWIQAKAAARNSSTLRA